MASTSGEQNIRGIDIDKMTKAYEDENLIFKKEVNVRKTSAREIRWYMKSSGYLSVDSPGVSSNVAPGARPFVVEQSWTRNTAHVKKFFLESPTITMEDESDSDVEVVLDNLQDITAKVAYDVDSRIWEVASESQSATNINSVSAGTAWDASTGQTPMSDVSLALQKIRENTKRKVKNPTIYLTSKDETSLKVWLTENKGQYFTEMASNLVENGVLTRFGGCRVVVSENVTDDYAMVGDMSKAVTWKEFKPITSAIIKDEGIGKKIRVWEEGEAELERPKFLTLIDNTQE